MAVLTNSKHRPVRLPSGGVEFGTVQLAGTAVEEIYIGSVLWSDGADGYFAAYDTTAAVAADIFGGVSLERISVVAADADGDKVASAAMDGIWGFAVGAIVVTDIGAAAYAEDDDVVGVTLLNNLWIGYVVDVDATFAWIDISDAALRANTAT